MPKERRNQNRDVRKRILIICEGKRTEPLYFKGIKSDTRSAGLNIKVMDRPKNSGLELVEYAIELKDAAVKDNNEYDSVWVVLDKDSYTQFEETFSIAGKNNIKIAFSSVSFELWYLLHYKYTTRPWRNSSEVEKELRKEYPEYDKTKSDTYSELKDKTPEAIERAESLRKHNQNDIDNGTPVYDLYCYTDVDVLVKELIS